MYVFLKYFGVIICYIYSATLLSQRKITIKNTVSIIAFSVMSSIIVDILRNLSSFIIIPIVFVITLLFLILVLGVQSYTISLISYTMGYVSFFIASIIANFISIYFDTWYEIGCILCFIIQILVCAIVLNNKRIRKSNVIFYEHIYSVPLCIICYLILILSAVLRNKGNDVQLIIVFIFMFLLSTIIFLYWRTSITRHYLERLSLRNIDSLNAELVEKTNYIKELEEDKARIEKLNHKNYKLIPAMEGAVMHYLDGVKSFVESNEDNPAFAEFAAAKETDMAGFIDEGNRLLGELNKMLAEWEDIVHNDDIDGKKDLPVCGVTRVDYILSYMYERSLKENFVLKVDVDSELTGLTEKIITDEDLGTLIADLIENAIIATRYNNGKDILVRLGMMKKEYTIEVYDSGIPFDKEVLAKYGYEQITTHADDSGSGIGMMQTYEILSKCGASLFIDEFAEGEGMYTKRISVVFNKKHQYVLYTKRSDEEVAYLKKRSDLMIVRK